MRSESLAVAYDCLFPYTTGGGERQYRGFATWLNARGFAVDYLTAVQWAEEDAPDETAFRVVPVARRLRLYDADGVRRTPAALAFAWGLFRSLVGRRRSFRAVIVSGLPVLNVFAARAALLGSGTQLVVDYLEVWARRQWVGYAGGLTGNLAWLLQRAAIALTPIATCHSQLSAASLRREGFRGRLVISPGLIDGGSDVAGTASAETPPYVLYAGRHIPDKRVESLPAAVSRAREYVPDLRLVILGTGPSQDAVTESIHAAKAETWVDRPGFVSEERLSALMGGAAVLVNPSRREGYGLVVVESAAHGTPVVLVEDPGNASTELIDPGVNGFVSDSVASEDLGAAIRAAIEGGDALRATTREWYDEALRTRTIERTVDGILAALDRVESQNHSGATDRDGLTEEGPQ